MSPVEARLPEPDHGLERVDPLPEEQRPDEDAGVVGREALGLGLALVNQGLDVGSPGAALFGD